MNSHNKSFVLGLVALCTGAAVSFATPIGGTLSVGAAAKATNEDAAASADSVSWSTTPSYLETGVAVWSGLPNYLHIIDPDNYDAGPGDSYANAGINANATWAADGNSGSMSIGYYWRSNSADYLRTNENLPNWSYTFTADASGNFVMDYNITASGTDLFGLQGFSLYPANDLDSGSGGPMFDAFDPTGSGQFVGAVTSGQTYTISLSNNGNISGSGFPAFGSVQGEFNWTLPGASPVPDAGHTLSLLGGTLLGLAWLRRKSACA